MIEIPEPPTIHACGCCSAAQAINRSDNEEKR